MCKCGTLKEANVESLEFNGNYYNMTICPICKFVETTPKIFSEINIYEFGHYEVKPYFFIPVFINLFDFILTRIHFYILKLSKTNKLLDFGCGKGYFLYFLKKIGFTDLSGVETSESRSAFARKITNLEISSDFYSGGKILGKVYNGVTMIHVLEHIKNPFDFLDILLDSGVEKNGFVYIEVPNIGSVSSKIAGHAWAHFTPHFHTNHFSIASFENYCKERKFKYKLFATFSFYNSAMGMSSALFSLFGYRGSIFEDMKKKKLIVIIPFILLLPVTIILEFLLSFFSKKGSVIKIAIKRL